MPKTVRAILGDIYDAWRAQNFDWMATYLPDDFCHVIHIPLDLHPLGGTRCGKKETLERLRLIAEAVRFRDLRYERTSDREQPRRGRGADPLSPPRIRHASNRPRRISGRSRTAGR